MIPSQASALRPLRPIERLSFSGVRDHDVARIASGQIGPNPFELIVEPHTLQLHVLLEDRELLTYARFLDGDDMALAVSLFEAIRVDINRGARDPDDLATKHSMEILDREQAHLAQMTPEPVVTAVH
jgi:hypothetical protein